MDKVIVSGSEVIIGETSSIESVHAHKRYGGLDRDIKVISVQFRNRIRAKDGAIYMDKHEISLTLNHARQLVQVLSKGISLYDDNPDLDHEIVHADDLELV